MLNSEKEKERKEEERGIGRETGSVGGLIFSSYFASQPEITAIVVKGCIILFAEKYTN